MKTKFRLLSHIMGILTCTALTQCAGDSTNVMNIDVNGAEAFITLDFSVEGTRASENETEINHNVVDIYVFDEEGKLETIDQINQDNQKVKTSSGFKTIYAISGMLTNGFMSAPENGTTSLEEFEEKLIKSTSDRLFTDNGCLMIGKAGPTQIIKSSEDNIPVTNNIKITLVRAMAKASLIVQENLSGLQLDFSNPEFCVCQTSDLMSIVERKGEIEHNKEDGNFMYTNFSNPIDGVTGKIRFLATDKVDYMAENISASHVSGNTTFVAIALKAVPQKSFSCQSGGSPVEMELTDKSSITDFYAVGVETPEMGIVAYAMNSNLEPYYFLVQADAENYAGKLNADMGLEGDSGIYKAVKFTEGIVYYRVNFNTPSGTEYPEEIYGKHSVLRNRHYKINVTSVNKLGAASESLLFPTDPDTRADITDAYLNATFTVADWQDVEQNTQLQ